MKISQAFRFEAAHRLPNVPPSHRCSRLHGHSYRIEVQLDGPVDPVTGFVADFFDMEASFADIMQALDHQCLNDVASSESDGRKHRGVDLGALETEAQISGFRAGLRDRR